MLEAGLAATPDAPALVGETRSLSWRELDEGSERLAGGYRGLGLEPGDRLASLMPNRIDLVVHYLACFKAGLIATPLNYRYTHREIDHALAVSGAKALVAHVERAGLERGTIGYGAGEAPDAAGGWDHSLEALLESDPLPAGRQRSTPPGRRRSSSPRAAPARPRASPTSARPCAG